MRSRNYIVVKYGLRHLIVDLIIVMLENIFKRIKKLFRRDRQ